MLLIHLANLSINKYQVLCTNVGVCCIHVNTYEHMNMSVHGKATAGIRYSPPLLSASLPSRQGLIESDTCLFS